MLATCACGDAVSPLPVVPGHAYGAHNGSATTTVTAGIAYKPSIAVTFTAIGGPTDQPVEQQADLRWRTDGGHGAATLLRALDGGLSSGYSPFADAIACILPIVSTRGTMCGSSLRSRLSQGQEQLLTSRLQGHRGLAFVCIEELAQVLIRRLLGGANGGEPCASGFCP